ncbi:ParB/RepB/Spo0J family partition protein [Pseudoalteromonas luteoviolacea]|uniref:ParB-like N-terminal domain-containing protein n=1 Tax=Pseudoalteromonas luteoviolacea S4060-1 TaxID=1365257 RepID=A0A167KVS6_9GAMM|nr:ParB/RepB/Spo0J family partition protein [Pseudoalteromonas luteoviolacea]KZN63365.1 hypothetical protein N478_03690 [Pseudoalteromonas luteoviolacea S4060-1]
MINGLTFEEMLADDGEGKTFIPCSKIKTYSGNRDLTTPEEKAAIQELTEQLEATDFRLIHPIRVQKLESGEYDYQLICGERRLTAFINAGKDEIEANVDEFGTFNDQQILEMNFIENEQRRNESIFSKAVRYRKYMSEYEVSIREAAKVIGMDKAKLSRLTNHVADMKKFEFIYSVYEGGCLDVTLLSSLVKMAKSELSTAKTVVEFCNSNNCLNRNFIQKVNQLDLHNTQDLESNLIRVLNGEQVLVSGEDNKAPVVEQGASEQGDSEQGDSEQGDSEQGDSEQGDSEQGDSEQGDSEQGDSEQGDSDDDLYDQAVQDQEEEEFELKSEVDGQNSNTFIQDGFTVENCKNVEIAIRYKGQLYFLSVNHQVLTKDGDDDMLYAFHGVTREPAVLKASECCIEYVVS